MRRIIILMYMFFLAFIPMPVFGQPGFSHWFQPLTGKQETAVSGRFEYSPRERVRDQDTGLEESRWEASILIPLDQGPDRKWTAVSRFGLRDIHTRAVLPDTGDNVPSELWDLPSSCR